jgi:hypothetical protein
MINHTTTTMNTSTLTEAVKALYEVCPMMPVKEIVENLSINHKHLIVDYRKVYNTLKRVSGGTSKTPKTAKVEKASIVLDLTQTPEGPAIPGVVVNSGK